MLVANWRRFITPITKSFTKFFMPGGTLRGFAERVALVVSGGAGLTGVGRAVAMQLALEGAFVIVTHAPDDVEAESVTKSLRELGTLAHAVAADVRREADIEQAFKTVDELYNRLDLLVFVADAGEASGVASFDNATSEIIDDCLGGGLRAAMLCARGAARLMRGRPSAGVVNVVRARGTSAIDEAICAGVIGLTESLASELMPRVRVNCVRIGENARDAGSDLMRMSLAHDEVARACLYLLSPEAKYITGQTLLVGSR